MGSLDNYRIALNRVGWFIPPYVTRRFIGKLVNEIKSKRTNFKQANLKGFLEKIYSPAHLAAMVAERYPVTPFISDFKEIISESVEAHFLGLSHISVAGLMPVIEGAGRKLADHRGISHDYVKNVFLNLANDCKNMSIQRGIGDSDEVESMMDSFVKFTNENLYVNSKDYPQEDKTNRNGILHGKYSDKDYGDPINFYKSIAAIDFLSFISAFDANISWLAPDSTENSKTLASNYQRCVELNRKR